MPLNKIEGADWLVKEQANEDVIGAAIAASSALMSVASDAENITGTSDLVACTPGTMMAALGALTFPILSSKSVTSSTPATYRHMVSDVAVTPSSSVAIGSNGSIAGMRGVVTLTSAKAITAGFLYGVQGKFIGDGATINNGSGHVAGLYGQMSGASMVVTSGHVAIGILSGQNLPTSANVDGLYLESGGGKINSVIKSNVKATYVLDITNFESGGNCSATGTPAATGATGWLKVFVDGAVRYIPLTDSVS